MNDNLHDFLGKGNIPDPFGPYTSRETRREVINGVERITRHVHIEGRTPEGFTNVIDEEQYLCQECQLAWLTPGVNAFIRDNKVLCEKCLTKAKIMSFFKPLWSPFVKFPQNK